MNLISTTSASSNSLTKSHREFWNKKIIIIAFNIPWFCAAVLTHIFFFFILQNEIKMGREEYKSHTSSQIEKQLQSGSKSEFWKLFIFTKVHVKAENMQRFYSLLIFLNTLHPSMESQKTMHNIKFILNVWFREFFGCEHTMIFKGIYVQTDSTLFN